MSSNTLMDDLDGRVRKEKAHITWRRNPDFN
jgi:hypothetical protein